MALRQSDVQIHNNPDLAVVDSDFVKGGFRTAVGSVSGLYALSGKTDLPAACGQVKEHATIVYVTGETKYYILKDVSNIANANGWEVFNTGGGGTLTGATNGIRLVNSGTSVALGDVTSFTGATFGGGLLQYSSHPNFSGYPYAMVDKQYVDDIATGLRPKAAVKVATTTNLTYPFSGLLTIDTITVSNGDRVLVKNQISGQTNGIWIASAGTWTRAEDFDGTPASETVSGAYMWVLTGSTNENTAWVLDTPDPIIINDITGTSLSFVLFAHVADVTAGTGIDVSAVTGTHIISINSAYQSEIHASITGATGGIGTSGRNVCLDAATQAILAAAITGGTNGLGYSGRNVCLGGNLIANTIVNTDNNSMSICNSSAAGLLIESGSTPSSFLGGLTYVLTEESTGSISLWADSGGTTVNALTHVGLCGTLPTSAYAESVVYANTLSSCSGHNLEIDRFEIYSCNNPLFSGATYNCDFSSNFVALSIPHVGWVRSQITGASTNAITGATNGVYAFSNHCVCLGGTLATPITFVGSNANHLKYNGDYAPFGARSIPDYAAVTGYTAQQSNIVAVDNQTSTGNYSASTSTEFVGAFTGSSIFLPPSPSIGQRISVVDWNGGAFTDNIIICSTTFPILNAQYATINSDYGSITFIFNGTFWSAIAYV